MTDQLLSDYNLSSFKMFLEFMDIFIILLNIQDFVIILP